MDNAIIAAIIGAIATIVAVFIGLRGKKVKKHTPSIHAFKLGYSLVELSRFARAKRLRLADDRPQRRLYEATLGKLNLLEKTLGLELNVVPSYDEHSDDVLFSHYKVYFEGFHEKIRHSFELGTTTGNILLNMLPDYQSFTMQGESRATDFLVMANRACDRLSSLWQSLFNESRSHSIGKIRDKVETLKSKKDRASLEALIKDCQIIAEEFLVEFEERVEEFA